MPHKDPEARRAYQAAYYQMHRQRLAEQERLRRDTDREAFRADRRASYARRRHHVREYEAGRHDQVNEWSRERNPRISLGGRQLVRINSLPEELRPLAQLIREARLLLRGDTR